MRRYNTKFIFYISKDLKKKLEKRSQELDISMSDYIRTLIKQDLKLNDIAYVNSIIDRQTFEIENINKKLSSYADGYTLYSNVSGKTGTGYIGGKSIFSDFFPFQCL